MSCSSSSFVRSLTSVCRLSRDGQMSSRKAHLVMPDGKFYSLELNGLDLRIMFGKGDHVSKDDTVKWSVRRC